MRVAPNPDLTVFADASVQPRIQASGWGYWARGDNRGSIVAGGPLRTYSPDTCLAELEALGMAVWHLSASNYFKVTDKVIMLQCDNIGALSVLRTLRHDVQDSPAKGGLPVPRIRNVDATKRDRAKYILQIADAYQLTVVVRHIKGHQNVNASGRNWVNDRCDKLAKDGAKGRWTNLQILVSEFGRREKANV